MKVPTIAALELRRREGDPQSRSVAAGLELWAGCECTVNRVQDRYFDQCLETGHGNRLEDIERLAELGVKAVRVPVLWESVAPDGLARADFGACDAVLARLRDLGIRPIIGLLHHGSGPPGHTLESADFVPAFAAYARAVAERYPWAHDFTPVNEPLTTARFCGLYGHWYPHGRDTATFLRLLMAETRGTSAAMRAIREVTKHARLVQTEDFGRTFSTLRLRHQREYENHRRWLSLDLLCGRVTREHVMWTHLEEHGVSPGELESLLQEPCVPDLIGINYYLTSDRFLDERLERYPAHLHGGNGREAYADLEAVRVRGQGIHGHERVIAETWRRYSVPLALTEVHLGCTSDEQVRWLVEAWNAARLSRTRGIDVRAVTAWAAFGSMDWDALLTRQSSHYEPGVFDVRGPAPRATALAEVARLLAAGGTPDHPVLDSPGWWQRKERLLYPPHGAPRSCSPRRAARQLLLAGSAIVGEGLLRVGDRRGLNPRRVPALEQALARVEAGRVWALVIEPLSQELVRRPERTLALIDKIVNACRRRHVKLVIFSSDRVFDGCARVPYVESDPTRPACSVGRTQRSLEMQVLATCPRALVVRTGPLLEPSHPACRLRALLGRSADDELAQAALDDQVSPTFLPHAYDVLLDLLVDGVDGIWHLANSGSATFRDLVNAAQARQHLARPAIETPTSTRLRPRMRVLSSNRASLMPTIEVALESYVSMLRLSPAFPPVQTT